MKVAILGGTRGMGRAIARVMAARGDRVCLLGRQTDELEKSAADLDIRGGGNTGVTMAHCDLAEPSTFEPALATAQASLDGLDAVVVTAGVFAPQAELADDPEKTEQLLTIDFTNTILFCEAARKLLLAAGGGTLCVFSSVAGERGRKPVVLYGAAKAGLSQYLEALDHTYRQEGLITVCVKPGFVKTGMTAGLPVPPFAGEPEPVARRVVKAIDRGRPEVYAPAIWGWIMAVIRLLPRAVMRRIGF